MKKIIEVIYSVAEVVCDVVGVVVVLLVGMVFLLTAIAIIVYYVNWLHSWFV